MKDHVFLEPSCVSWATLSEPIHSRWMVIWFFSTSLVLLVASTFLVLLVATWTPNPKLLSFALILPLALNTCCSRFYEGGDCNVPTRGGCPWGRRGCHAKLQTSRSIRCAWQFSMTLLAWKMHGVALSNRDLCKHSIDLTCCVAWPWCGPTQQKHILWAIIPRWESSWFLINDGQENTYTSLHCRHAIFSICMVGMSLDRPRPWTNMWGWILVHQSSKMSN